MSDTPKPSIDPERAALLAAWLKPVKPANPPRPTLVERISPWRHGLVDAVTQGYTWTQLAKEVAAKPEIGLTITGGHLKKLVHDAFVAAKERSPAVAKLPRRNKRAKIAAKTAPTAAKPSPVGS